MIDGELRLKAKCVVIKKRAVGPALASNYGQAAVNELLRHFDAKLFCIVEGQQHGCRGEACRLARRLLRARGKIVISPAAVDRLVAIEQLDLLLDLLAE